MRAGLTKQQQRCLEFINGYIDTNSNAPSYVDIIDGLGLASKSGAYRLVTALAKRGYITRLPHRARSIAIVAEVDTEMPRLRQIAGAAKSYFQAHDAWQVFRHRHPHHADNSEYHAPLVSERFNRLKELVR
jgi:SOS-response transcriptional repressor LexA